MTPATTALLVHLVVVHGPHTFMGKSWRRTFMVAGGAQDEAVDRVQDHLARPENCTAELSPGHVSEELVRSKSLHPGEIRELSRAYE